MTLHLKTIINSLLIALILFGCHEKTTEISNLIEDGKFIEAQELINQLSPEEKSTPEIKLLALKANSGIILINATKMVKQREYDQALDYLILKRNQYARFPFVIDTLNSKIRQWSIQGAEFYNSIKQYEKTYSFLIKADKNTRLNDEGILLLNETRKMMISGLWLGSSDQTKHKIRFKLTALTGSTFDGIAIVEGAMFENPIRGGFFDGNELSATMEYKYRIPITRSYPLSGIGRQVVGYNPGSENFTISGNVSNGIMKIAIKEINMVSHWTLKKKTD